MSLVVIPLAAKANQTLTARLDGVGTLTIGLATTPFGLFATVALDGTAICTSRKCLDRVRLNPDAYRGLTGKLAFVDTAGTSDPEYTGFALDPADARYLLMYSADD